MSVGKPIPARPIWVADIGCAATGWQGRFEFIETEQSLNTGKHSRNFWIGNGVLAVAMLALLFMGPLSDALGIWAAVLWMVLAALGMTLVMADKTDEPPAPD